MDNLDKKSILITGGATGLGFAMAKRFSEKGAFVTICGRRKEKLCECSFAEKLKCKLSK